MAQPIRKSRVKEVPLSEVKDDLSRFLREAEDREIVITRHGRPAGVLIGFKSEDDWFDYRLENDPRFLRSDNAFGRTVKYRGSTVLAMDCALAGAEWPRWAAAQLGH